MRIHLKVKDGPIFGTLCGIRWYHPSPRQVTDVRYDVTCKGCLKKMEAEHEP